MLVDGAVLRPAVKNESMPYVASKGGSFHRDSISAGQNDDCDDDVDADGYVERVD